jgi:hypothetical protein
MLATENQLLLLARMSWYCCMKAQGTMDHGSDMGYLAAQPQLQQ